MSCDTIVGRGVKVQLEAVAGGKHQHAPDATARRNPRCQAMGALEDTNVVEIELVVGGVQQLKVHDCSGSTG